MRYRGLRKTDSDEDEFYGLMICDECGKSIICECWDDNIMWDSRWLSMAQLSSKPYDVCPDCRKVSEKVSVRNCERISRNPNNN